jgi:2-aminoadipate transaminase
MIYVVPNFQNPSGRTWSVERRRLLMEVANRRRIPVVEDNPYGEIRFEEVGIPSLRTFDEQGLVICLGTFSKIFCPGLRLGWVAAGPPILGKLVILKQGADLHSSTLNQMQASAYFERPEAEERIGRIAALYRERKEAMVRALEREMPEGTRFSRPQGGLFLWVELPAGIDSRALLARCLDLGVVFVPGGAFFPNGGGENALRLNFSNMPAPRIEEGIRRLGRAAREMLPQRELPGGWPGHAVAGQTR